MRSGVGLLLILLACSPGAAPPAAAMVDVKAVSRADGGIAEEVDAGPEPVRLPPMRAADRLFAEGRAYAQAGQHAAALDRFESAYRISPSDEILYWIGRSLENLGRRGEAAMIYERYLQSELSPTDRMSMEMRIRELRGHQP